MVSLHRLCLYYGFIPAARTQSPTKATASKNSSRPQFRQDVFSGCGGMLAASDGSLHPIWQQCSVLGPNCGFSARFIACVRLRGAGTCSR